MKCLLTLMKPLQHCPFSGDLSLSKLALQCCGSSDVAEACTGTKCWSSCDIYSMMSLVVSSLTQLPLHQQWQCSMVSDLPALLWWLCIHLLCGCHAAAAGLVSTGRAQRLRHQNCHQYFAAAGPPSIRLQGHQQEVRGVLQPAAC